MIIKVRVPSLAGPYRQFLEELLDQEFGNCRDHRGKNFKLSSYIVVKDLEALLDRTEEDLVRTITYSRYLHGLRINTYPVIAHPKILSLVGRDIQKLIENTLKETPTFLQEKFDA